MKIGNGGPLGSLGLALALHAGLGAEPAAAQAAPPAPPVDAARQGEVLQRQQQEQIQQDVTRILTSPQPQTVIEVPTHEKAVASQGSCREIKAIEFEHSPLLDEGRRRELTAPYIGRCLGLGDVENLLSDITRFYIEKSRPTTRVYIKPQSLQQGVLVLDVVEGKVEKVVLDDKAKGTINMTGAFGNVANKAFNLRVFEQGLDQVNRLASNHATLDILPGSQPGYSVVRISNRVGSRLHVSGSYDNTGQPSTGRNQATGTVILDNVLGINDLISYSRRQTVFPGGPNRDSRSNSVLFSVPRNALTLSGGYNDSDYTSQTVTGGGTVFVLTGHNATAFGRADLQVYRDSHNKVELSAQITNKRNRNYINGIYLPVSSRVLTVLEFDANWSILVGRGSLKLGMGAVKGLKALGALDDAIAQTGPGGPRAQFTKLTAHAYYSIALPAGRTSVVFSSEVEAQYAFDPLYSSEQMVIGSPFTVRGFLVGSLVADRGAFLQNDLTALLPVQIGPLRGLIRPHLGLDGGFVGSASPGGPSGTIAGVSGGVGVSAGPVNLDFTASRAIARGPLPDEGTLAFVRASLSF